MWFGDLVTMRWFNDVWMKEVFANLMAEKIVNPAFPTVNHDLRFLTAMYPPAYGVDRTLGTHPIRQELANLTGTTLETAIRVMSRWRQQGLVTTTRRGFVLHDRAGLEAMSWG